ncbi:MAG: DsbC family protein [Mariprofundaceae bacterium]
MASLFLSAQAALAEEEAAEANPVAAIEQAIHAANPDLLIEHVLPLEKIPGLYEVRVGNNIYYTDSSGHYLIVGHIFDTATKQDLTEARMDELSRVDWSMLPLDKSIVSGDPEGTPIAVFTDPDCPFCGRLESEMANVTGLKIHTFLYPLESIHPNARAKAESIWCAENQVEALHAVLVERQSLDSAACENPVGDIVRLGSQLGISGTPAIIATDGRMHSGLMSADDLMRWAVAK